MLHHLPCSRPAKRHIVLPLWCKPFTFLGVCSRLDIGSDARDMGAIRWRGEGRRGRIYSTAVIKCRRHGARASRLLLSVSYRQLAASTRLSWFRLSIASAPIYAIIACESFPASLSIFSADLVPRRSRPAYACTPQFPPSQQDESDRQDENSENVGRDRPPTIPAMARHVCILTGWKR